MTATLLIVVWMVLLLAYGWWNWRPSGSPVTLPSDSPKWGWEITDEEITWD